MLMPGCGVSRRLSQAYFETSASKYFWEIFVRVPSAASSPRALLMASVRLVDPLRRAKALSDLSVVSAAILMPVSGAYWESR